jgi:GNAT superfamily N-acetyltransferase
MTIRPANVDDADALCDLHVRSIRVLCAADYTPEQIEAWCRPKAPEKYRKAMTEGGETMFVAVEEDGSLAGFASFKGDELYAVYVAPESIRRGVGRRLLETVEAAARQAGTTQLRFRSTITAVEFYLRCGYQKGDPACARMSGVEIPCVWMTKTL